MRISYIVSALAAAGSAAAQCSTATKTIQNSGDASALASCQTFTGNIVIATQTSDDINLAGVKVIKGDITAKNVNNMASFSADSLQSIQGTFMLDGVRGLTSFSFPQLSSVNVINWATLTKLNGLDFATGIDHASTVSITDTQLASLDGINLKTVDSLTLSSNGILSKVDLDLTHFTDGLTITGNGAGLKLSLPNLRYGKTFTLQDLGSLDIPQLGSVNGTINLISNQISEFSAPKLVEVGDGLFIKQNSNLQSIDLPKLTTVDGGFSINSNAKLEKIDGIDALTSIDGALDFTGSFDEADLPKLAHVSGAFNMQSTQDISKICDQFDDQHGRNKLIRGKYTCKSKTDNPTGLKNPGATAGGDDSGSGGNDTGAASALFPSLLTVGAAAGLGAFFGVF